SQALAGERISRGVAFGDYDNDGDVDVLINNMEGPPTLLQNSTRNQNHWVSLLLKGRGKNPGGIGARVVLTVGGKTLSREVKGGHSYLSQSDLRLHIGLGTTHEIENLEIHWPDGALEKVSDVLANRLLLVEQGSGVATLLRH
ncbi:MAG: ASPIC/UnbV domain-containing protein, partial [Acidobacteriota bacterium]